MLCTSVVLDRGPEELVQRLSNKVYDMCRANTLTLVGFPLFGPVVAAIQEARVETPSTQFQVTVKKHDRLVILQSLAEKWMTTEFKDATVQEVEAHNQKFNKGGEYWHQEEQRPGVNMLSHWVMLEITSNLQIKPKLFTVIPLPPWLLYFTCSTPISSNVPAFARNTDEGTRPMKRIRLEEAEIVKEADVVNLQKPQLEFTKGYFWWEKI